MPAAFKTASYKTFDFSVYSEYIWTR